MTETLHADPLDPLREVQMMAELVFAEQRRDALRAAVIRHERRIARARARLAGAEGQIVIAGHARAEAHHAVGTAMLAAYDADRACAKARLRVREATDALRAVEREEVVPPAEDITA